MSETKKLLWLVVRLPDPIGAIEFYNLGEFEKWIENEYTIFSENFNGIKGNQIGQSAYNIGDEQFKKITGELNRLKNAADDKVEVLKREVEATFNRYVPSAESPTGAFMQRIRKDYRGNQATSAAYFTLLRFQNPQFPDDGKVTDVMGAMLCLIHYERIPTQWDGKLAVEMYSDYKAKVARLDAEYTELHAKFTTLEANFTAIRKLEEPIRYWDEKRRVHRCGSIGLSLLFALTIGLVLGEQLRSVFARGMN